VRFWYIKRLIAGCIAFVAVCDGLQAQVRANLYHTGTDSPGVYTDYSSLRFTEDSIYIELSDRHILRFGNQEADSVITSRFHIIKKTIIRNGERKEAFIQPLILGKADLYTSHFKGREVFYVEKNKGGIYYIPPAHSLNYIYWFFHDCKALDLSLPVKMPDRFTYTMTGWLQLLTIYNNCSHHSGESVTYYRKAPVTYSKYLFAGVLTSRATMNTEPYNSQTFKNSYSPYAGILLGLLYRERVGFFSGLSYVKLHNSTHFSAPGIRFDDQMNLIWVKVDIQLAYDLDMVQIPAIIRFVPFRRGSYSIDIDAGGIINVLLFNTSHVQADDNYKPVVDYTYDMSMEQFSPGIYGGVGVSFPFFSKRGRAQFNVSRAYYSADPITSYHYSSSDSQVVFTSYGLSAGIYF